LDQVSARAESIGEFLALKWEEAHFFKDLILTNSERIPPHTRITVKMDTANEGILY
jgi:hypothetical protein